jgi:hypothetical protein
LPAQGREPESKRELSFHNFGYSFATHLLEKGTDVQDIQQILGHFSIKITKRYLHVANEKLVVIEKSARQPVEGISKFTGAGRLSHQTIFYTKSDIFDIQWIYYISIRVIS